MLYGTLVLRGVIYNDEATLHHSKNCDGRKLCVEFKNGK